MSPARTSGWSVFFLQLFIHIADSAPDVETAIGDFFRGAGETLIATDWQDACPIAVIAFEVASTSEPLRIATADVFTTWLDEATARFIAAGAAAVAQVCAALAAP